MAMAANKPCICLSLACSLRSRVNFTMAKEKLKEQIDTVISVYVLYLTHWIKVNIYGKTVASNTKRIHPNKTERKGKTRENACVTQQWIAWE